MKLKRSRVTEWNIVAGRCFHKANKTQEGAVCIGGQRQEAGTAARGHRREGQLVGLRTKGRRGFNTEEKAKGGGGGEKKTGCE